MIITLYIHVRIILQERIFFFIGQLIATGIIQAAATFPLFNKVVYKYLSGNSVSDLTPSISDIPEKSTADFLHKLQCDKSLSSSTHALGIVYLLLLQYNLLFNDMYFHILFFIGTTVKIR